jgi:broad specificity phosphatase PhoE
MQGQQYYELTPKGELQARLTAERLEEMGVHAVYTSPLLRASETAKTISERLGVTPVDLAGVREYDFGEMSGATYAEVRQVFAAATPEGVQVRPQDRVYPGEEGRDAFLKRVTDSLWEVVERHPDESVAVVSHGGPIALFCQTVLALPYTRPMPFSIDNCSLTVIRVRDGAGEEPGRPRAVLVALNDCCHLKNLVAE